MIFLLLLIFLQMLRTGYSQKGRWLSEMRMGGWARLVVMIVCLCSVCLAYSEADTQAEMQYVRQLVGKDASHRTIVWQSEAVDESAVVQYRRQGDAETCRVRPKIERCETGGESLFRYRADITALPVDVVCEYRIVSRSHQSAWRRLTAQTDRYTAIVFTDSQCAGDYRTWAELVQAARERVRDASLCLHLGDLVDCGASQYQWDRWLTGAEEMLAECVFAPTMGNHEDYDEVWQMMLPQYYRALFPVVEAGDDMLDGHVYSFDYGGVHYAVLDTQAEELSAWKHGWTARQAQWLERDLAETSAGWKVILCHKPFYEMDGTMTEHGRAWLPICRRYNVRLILSGHHHIYSRGKVGDITMITAGVSGDDTGYEPQAGGNDIIALRCDMPNYLTMKVTDDTLHVRAVQADGKIMDETVIRHQ